MSYPRIRLRTFLVGVAILALMMGILRERHDRFRSLANGYAHGRGQIGAGGMPNSNMTISWDVQGYRILDQERFEHFDDWLFEMQEKYKCAALHPYFPVLSDSPAPEMYPRIASDIPHTFKITGSRRDVVYPTRKAIKLVSPVSKR